MDEGSQNSFVVLLAHCTSVADGIFIPQVCTSKQEYPLVGVPSQEFLDVVHGSYPPKQTSQLILLYVESLLKNVVALACY